jgi:superfamily II RNA helicase
VTDPIRAPRPSPKSPLAEQLFRVAPDPSQVTGDELLDRFLDYVKELGLELYPAQEEAILEIFAGKNLILSTPTGSGKSLVATAAHFRAMALRERSFYTCPIKALVNEKFFALSRAFGPENVGMMTGDASINRDAPIICCTAEILSNLALREGENADVHTVVMDEFHYYADRDRGTAWQVPLLTLPQAKFVLMSATLGPTELFEKALTKLNGAETAVVASGARPVPLDFEYRETPLHETILDLVRTDRYPIYVVAFTQRACAEQAQNLMSTDYSTKDEKKAIHAALVGTRWSSPYAKEVQKYLRHGIAIHHAGLLPKYRLLTERLAQTGLLKVICGTDTLGVGVNIPIRTVLFTQLCKYDGEKTSILSVRDFQQISGRAGRKGFDDRGSVVVQAPEHVIENLRLESKAGGDPAKKRKIVKRKPPERGYVHWDRATFNRLVTSPPEPLASRFAITHGMLLSVLARGRGGCRAMARLIRDSHTRRPEKRALARTAVTLFQSLLGAKVLEVNPETREVALHVDLQDDFSLHHALGLYLIDTLSLLDPETPTYGLDVLTLVESILENPQLILDRQLDKMKTEKLAELKAAGVEYDERMVELEKLEYPKPNRDFIYGTFNAFAAKHPWVGAENIRPKSIAREMYENLLSFPDYVKEYGIERAEGLVLRYLSEVYKALVQTVPAANKNDAVEDVVTYLGAIVRSVDSSLLDEWERMHAGEDAAPKDPSEEPVDTSDVTRDPKAFTVLVRNAVFSLVRALAKRDYVLAVSLLDTAAPADEAWTPRRFEEALAPYWAEHGAIRVDPEARSPKNLKIEWLETRLSVEQVLWDPEEANDWMLALSIDREASRIEGRPMLRLDALRT